MDAEQLLSGLEAKGVRLWVSEGRIAYRGPKGALGADDVKCIREQRAQIVEILERSALVSEPTLTRRLPSRPVPLSASQRYCWNLLDSRQRRGTRSVAEAVRIRGALNVAILDRCFHSLIHKHEILRVRISQRGQQLVQVLSEDSIALDVVSVPMDSAQPRELTAQHLAEAVTHERVDPTEGPMFAARLIRVDVEEHFLVVALDHLISDHVSLQIIYREIWDDYDRELRGAPTPTRGENIGFLDYAVWQASNEPSWARSHADYWERRLGNVGVLRLPFARTAEGPWVGSTSVPVVIEQETTRRLRTLSQRNSTTFATSVLTAYAAAFLRQCRSNDLVVQFLVTGRDRSELENMIGFLASRLYLRITLQQNDSFLDLLRRVSLEYSRAYEHFDAYRLTAQVPRPDFTLNTLFSWLPESPATPAPVSDVPRDTLVVEPLLLAPAPDLYETMEEPALELWAAPEGLAGRLNYDPRRYDRTSIVEFVESITLFIERLASHGELAVPLSLGEVDRMGD